MVNLSLIKRIVIGFSLVTACAIALSFSAYMSQQRMEEQFNYSAVILTKLLDQSVELDNKVQLINRLTLIHANAKEAEKRQSLEEAINDNIKDLEQRINSLIADVKEYPLLSDQLSSIVAQTNTINTASLNHIVLHNGRIQAYQRVFTEMAEFDATWEFFDFDVLDAIEQMKASNDSSIQSSSWILESLFQETNVIADQLGKLVGVNLLESLVIIEKQLETSASGIKNKLDIAYTSIPNSESLLSSYIDTLMYQLNDPNGLFTQYKAYLNYNQESQMALDSLTQDVTDLSQVFEQVSASIRQLSADAYVMSNSDNQNSFWINLVLTLVTIAISIMVTANVIRSIRSPLKEIQSALSKMAEGDFTSRINQQYQSELGEIASGINGLSLKLKELLTDIKNTDSKVNDFAVRGQEQGKQVVEQVALQQQRADSMATAVTQMEQAVTEVSTSAASSSNSVTDIVEVAKQNMMSMKTNVGFVEALQDSLGLASKVITDLSNQSQQIDEILQVIQSISEQTNLLALNAAIEAARAGEHGRGFAVVADEVRSLANRTQVSANEIGTMIESLQSNSKQAVRLVEDNLQQSEKSVSHSNKTHDSLLEMVEQLVSVNDMSQTIAAASEEQSAVVKEVARNIVDVSDLAHQISENAALSSNNSAELSQLSDAQSKLIDQFRLA
ncbi:methyl-accepting chemotaxis protein [Alginatibacterium sediminis]|uniref:Methyl-accepting chemotaxis protein n=1 Tax=Alginatibacterium sediminis TaxID=2164068 RepID=A0A420E8M0_9ALTE|nr:HAMP domain-containing methyl-accepting chemotaxis protein [Alginatibacterium sediminis]RKF15760.1 methyl-accepting chemotaxis protein [Alginatibacterium sediminis]